MMNFLIGNFILQQTDWIKENKEVVMGAAFVLIIAITVAIMVPTGGTSAVTIPSVLTAVEAAFI